MDGTKVKVSWTAPSNSGGTGVPVTAYQVLFKQSDGLYSTIHAECDGTSATIVAALQCEVEMTTLLSAPFNLLEGTLVVVVVQALNVIDYSVPSAPNTVGVLAQVVPHAPTSAPVRGASTTESQIEATMATVTSTGGSPIISYSLEINDGSGFVSVAGDPIYQLS